jgi:hypothetical protein
MFMLYGRSWPRGSANVIMKAVAADPILASGKLPDSFAEIPQSPAKCGNHLKRLAMCVAGGKIEKLSEISGISACSRMALLTGLS